MEEVVSSLFAGLYTVITVNELKYIDFSRFFHNRPIYWVFTGKSGHFVVVMLPSAAAPLYFPCWIFGCIQPEL